MPSLFSKETVQGAGQFQDRGKLVEIDKHELLRTDEGDSQIAAFEEVKEIGKWFLKLPFDKKPFLTTPPVMPHQLTSPNPDVLLERHQKTGAGAFWGKLALGADAESQFPVTIELITTEKGHDLRLHIVPIHFGALEVAQFSKPSDSLLALAAAAAVAPQFILALEGGIATTHCATKKEVVTSITPDHGTPLAVTFDAFGQGQQTLDTAISITGDRHLSIKQAAHLHGQEKSQTQLISKAAAGSKIAAGVPLLTMLRSELPQHALFIQTNDDGFGNQKIVTVNESLSIGSIVSPDLSLIAVVLGFTARVVGDSAKEHTIERVLKPANADIPLAELVRR